MNRSEIASAVAARERGQSMVRSLTAVAGVAGFAATGVIAFLLPGTTHRAGTSTPNTTGPSSSSSVSSSNSASPPARMTPAASTPATPRHQVRGAAPPLPAAHRPAGKPVVTERGAHQRWGAASWRALGTRVRIVTADGRHLDEARRLLEADLADVDAACSRFRPDS